MAKPIVQSSSMARMMSALVVLRTFLRTHGGSIVPEQTVENVNEDLEVLADEDYIMSMGF